MIYRYLPYCIFKSLFGDRKKWGLLPNYEDEDFKNWNINNQFFYNNTQKKGVGTLVNHFGFKIMKYIDLKNKILLEVGPGIIEHLDYNTTKPKEYILADIREEYLIKSKEKLKDYGIYKAKTMKVEKLKIPLSDNSVDIIITFHQLEHIYELDEYLQELKRILKPDGILIGAVPTEGG